MKGDDPMQKWEYEFQVFSLAGKGNDIEEATKRLNEAGDEGWEIVSVMPKMGKNDSWGIAVLKRPKQ
jgi:hypothetical protein